VIFKISKEIYETKYKKDSKVSLFIKIDDELIWNKELKQLTYKEEILKLTKKELYLVELLLKYPEKTYSNEEIISYLWRDDFESQGDISNLKNIISRLRKKIPLLNVENIYSFGYRLTIKN
jgi:DNA-binding response OmpR family regulator